MGSKEASSKWKKTHREQVRESCRLYSQTPKGKAVRYAAKIKCRQKLRVEVLTHYGGGKLACVQCGETRMDALTIDHIQGNGRAERIKLGKHGTAFYFWLRNQGYPEGYQTLCMNCQFVKRAKNKEYYIGG